MSKSRTGKAAERKRRGLERKRRIAYRLRDRLRDAEQEATRIDDQIARASQRLIDEDELVGAIEAFDPVWDALSPRERERLIHLLVKQVGYDVGQETISVTFNPTGIKELSVEEVVA